MREPSTLCAILDDCAATGNVDKLIALEARVRRHQSARRPAVKRVVWAETLSAVRWRLVAVRNRLAGRIDQALEYERMSETALRKLAQRGKRVSHG